MTPPKWLVPILALALIAVAGGWLRAGEEMAPDVAPTSPATAATPIAGPRQVGVPAPEQEVVSEQAGTPRQESPALPVESTEQEQGLGEGAPAASPPVPPYALQTLADERRDLLRKRREALLDSYGTPRQYMPPWFGSYNESVERYRDARRSAYRQQRDFDRRRHTSWMDSICPWSKPQRTWSAQRSYQRQMEQLDRREYRDDSMSWPPPAFSGYRGW